MPEPDPDAYLDVIDAAVQTGVTSILIAGPTASGKSRLALDLAQRYGGAIVNADSMQVYAELSVLSVRPSAIDEASIPHRLYGHVTGATRYSVGRWLADVAVTIEDLSRQGLRPIVVGGTGLYFKALTEGLATIPPIPAALRDRLAAESETLASEEMHRRLAVVDAESAAEIRPSDRSRIVRALEVFEATGRSVLSWRRGQASPPLIDRATALCLVVEPERGRLHARIAERADRMVHDGAEAEVRTLLALGLASDLPAMKAIGVREFADHFTGKLSLAETIAAIKTETRRYAKRQMTWFRNQMPGWRRIDPAAISD